MYFSLLPPEINSGNMYAGAGSASLTAAATAWGRLSSELGSAAAEYNAVLASLASESWTGPSAAAMTAAAEPYTAWMSSTAAIAAQAAAQAQAAATAYEAAHAATIPPEVVAANRTQNQMLYATNFLGQNLAAIAANEAQYMEMWAQDAAAMETYAASATAATKITAFTEPPQTTTGTAAATSASSVGSAATTAGSSQILQFFADIATQYNTFINNALASLTGNPTAGATFSAMFAALKAPIGLTTQFNDTSLLVNWPIAAFTKFGTPLGRVFEGLPLTGLGAGLHAGATSAGLTSSVSAGMAEANLVGNLSVPPSWASASPAIRLAATGVPAAGLGAAPAAGMAGGLFNQAALGSMAGGALGSASPRTAVGGGRIRIQGGKAKTPVKLDAVIAKLQSQPEAVQHWNVDQAGLDELLDELSRKPGVHAVHLKGAKKAAAPLS
ncbi:PPE family protein [Mycolicibacter arupensis]|jgi:PPE-repeat protein|uniref:PPE family protein n=1 Tax=Mycolicibacter arupensis TaxID=342002 RepID=A0A5C7XRI0_9MYCO|nr:PPE family protein [Mycolicibacter arupensis]TXI51744.1 MAG: PPE family protein [Mycolicibacter arupensis]